MCTTHRGCKRSVIFIESQPGKVNFYKIGNHSPASQQVEIDASGAPNLPATSSSCASKQLALVCCQDMSQLHPLAVTCAADGINTTKSVCFPTTISKVMQLFCVRCIGFMRSETADAERNLWAFLSNDYVLTYIHDCYKVSLSKLPSMTHH